MSEQTASETTPRLPADRLLAPAPNAPPALPVGRTTGSSLRPKLLLMAADVLAIVTFTTMAAVLVSIWDLGALEAGHQLWWASVVVIPAWLAIFANQRLYNTRFIGRRIDEFRRVVNASVLGTLTVALTANIAGILPSRGGLVLLGACAVLVVTIEREIARRMFLRLRANGQMVRSVIIAGANPEGRDIAAMLQAEPWLGYEVVGFVDDFVPAREPVPGIPLLGGVAELPGILHEFPNASVIGAASAVESAVTNRLARDLLDQGVHVELSSTLRDISSQRLTVRPLGRFPIVYVEPVVRSGWRAVAKRAFDMVGAAIGLVLTSPILILAAIAIRLDSKGGVLFHQTRVGRNSKPFQVLKLRTMVADAESKLQDLAD